MQAVDLLLVGDALDGPTEEITWIRSLEQGLRLFGGYAYERITLTSTTSGHTLSGEPWGGEVAVLQYDGDGELVPLSLFEFTVSGSVLTWTKPGTTWYDSNDQPSQVTFRYRVNPSSTSLIKGIEGALGLGVRVHALRLGGEHASITSGAYSFYAHYPGSRYNGTTVTCSGGTVTVVPAPGTGRPCVYTPTSDSDLRSQLDRDRYRGRQPLYYSQGGSDTGLTLPTGVLTLSGGTDGTLTTALLSGFVDTFDLTGVDVLCPLGISLSGALSGGVVSILEELPYPTLLVLPSSVQSVTLSGSPNPSRYVVPVAFSVEYRSGSPQAKTDDAAPVVAALIARDRHNLTLAPLPQRTFSPHYSQSGLHALATAGYVGALVSISKGPALWYVVTGDSDWPASTFRAYQEVVRATYQVLEPLLGNTALRLADVEEHLAAAYSQVTGSKVLDFTLQLQGETLFADVSLQPHGEVRTVQAQINLGAVSPS